MQVLFVAIRRVVFAGCPVIKILLVVFILIIMEAFKWTGE
jgi:hypothetical protein